jgi:ubiquinone/menaquinone biosynthesis C-methylase UbiE
MEIDMSVAATSETFNSSRARLWQESAAFAAGIPRGALVLDAGAGSSPYKPLFAHTQYESADFERVTKSYAPQTYTCDLAAIPVEDDRFDAVVFNQVMEHLPEPYLVLRELYRVLKPGGSMIYSAPLFYEEHEQPYDFYRYTQFGVRHLFQKAGFELERLDWLEGYFGTLGYQCTSAARMLPRHPRRFGGGAVGVLAAAAATILRPAFGLVGAGLQRLEMRHKHTATGYPKNYVVIARKPLPM